MLLQLTRRRKVPHLVINCFWNMHDTPLRRALQRLQYRLEVGAVSRFVVWSRCQVKQYSTVYGPPAEKVVFVPFPTSLYGASYAVSDGDYVFAGGDSNRDYPTLIEAAKGLPYRVIIAANRRDHFRGIDIPTNVEILTATHVQYFNLMAGAGVVAVPMRAGLLHSGGHQTYLNAMAMGKPVVVADDCGADDYIDHKVTGMLVQPGDSAGMRDMLSTLLEDRSLARSLGGNAKAAAMVFSPEKFFERVFGLADECVEGCNG